MDNSTKNSTHGNVNDQLVRDCARKFEDADRSTALAIGRRWAQEARAKGIDEAQVQKVIDETFGTSPSAR